MFGKSERLLEDIDYLLDSNLEKKLNHAFAKSFNLYLEKFRDMVDYEKELINKSSKKAISEITKASNKLVNIDSLLEINSNLSNEVENLVKELKKRDAIIERKNKQIAKLKEQ